MWYLLGVIAIVAIAIAIKSIHGKTQSSTKEDLEYQQVSSLLTPAESVFLATLDEVGG